MPASARGPRHRKDPTLSIYQCDADRVTLNVAVDEASGCWNWRLTIGRHGYGQMGVRRRTFLAHRFSYEALVGPIPSGMQLDHLCRNRPCVNPDHLEPVTPQVNIHRSPIAPGAINARKTHCPKGHGYTPSNTYYQRNGGRLCRTCQANRPRKGVSA